MSWVAAWAVKLHRTAACPSAAGWPGPEAEVPGSVSIADSQRFAGFGLRLVHRIGPGRSPVTTSSGHLQRRYVTGFRPAARRTPPIQSGERPGPIR